MEEIFFEIGAIIIIAAALSLLIFRLRQPLIIAYIVSGILIGPSFFALTKSSAVFDTLAQVGVAFLLFTVGLGLNWRHIREIGGIALATGLGQVVFSVLLGWLLAVKLGFDSVTSLYLAIAFSFSSTIIVVKLLMDKQELDTLYGRVSVGFLLVQDFIAMLLLLVLGGLSSGGTLPDIFAQSLLKAVVVIPVLWVISAKIVPPLVHYAAKSQELLFIFAIAWCFLIAAGFVWAGFGVEFGALIAGVTLSGTMFQKEINSRIRPLRDFFLILYFIKLGTGLGMGDFELAWLPIVVFSLLVLVGKPLVVVLIMRLTGYHWRTGFLTGGSIAQISEFSFIVLAAGVALGHVSESTLVLATAVGLVTIAGSSYFIARGEGWYEAVQRLFLKRCPRRPSRRPSGLRAPQVVLFGCGQGGRQLLPAVKKSGHRYLLVDFDPAVVRELNAAGEPVIYGDAGDENFLSEIALERARLVLSSVPDAIVSHEILSYLKKKQYRGPVVVSVLKESEAESCYAAGAAFVSVPMVLSGERLSGHFARHGLNRRSWKSINLV